MTLVSTAFMPLAALPDWLQPFAQWNPVSTLTVSLRQLWGNPNPTAVTTDSPATHDPILVTLIWVAAIVGIFAPLGIRRYRSLSR